MGCGSSQPLGQVLNAGPAEPACKHNAVNPPTSEAQTTAADLFLEEQGCCKGGFNKHASHLPNAQLHAPVEVAGPGPLAQPLPDLTKTAPCQERAGSSKADEADAAAAGAMAGNVLGKLRLGNDDGLDTSGPQLTARPVDADKQGQQDQATEPAIADNVLNQCQKGGEAATSTSAHQALVKLATGSGDPLQLNLVGKSQRQEVLGLPLHELIHLADECFQWFPEALVPDAIKQLKPQAPLDVAMYVVTVHNYASFVHVVRALAAALPHESCVWLAALEEKNSSYELEAHAWSAAMQRFDLAGRNMAESDRHNLKALIWEVEGPEKLELRYVVGTEAAMTTVSLWRVSGLEGVVGLAEPQCIMDQAVVEQLGLLKTSEAVEMQREELMQEVEELYMELCESPSYQNLQHEEERERGESARPSWERDVPPEHRSLVVRGGVSLLFLLELKGLVQAWHQTATTRMVAQKFVKPYTADKGCRYFEQLPAKDVGQPTFFVSQMQDATFCGLVDAVHSHLLDADPRKVFVWIDIFAINQHSPGAELPFLSASLQGSKLGTLMVLRGKSDRDTPMDRAWCVLEVWSTMRLRGPGKMLFVGQSRIPPEVWSDMVATLDIRNCSAFSEKDRRHILQKVESYEGGADSLNRDVKLLLKLQPEFYDSDMQNLQEGEGEVDLDKIQAWCKEEDPGARVLWLQGSSGSGKSTVSTALVKDPPVGVALLHVFVKHNDLRKQSPYRALRSLAFQLSERFRGCRLSCFEQIRVEDVSDWRIEEAGGMKAATELLMTAPLRELRQHHGVSTPVVVLVDALDEGLSVAQGAVLSDVLKCHQNHMLRLVTDHLALLPPELDVRVIATSRPPSDPREQYLERLFSKLGNQVLRMDVAKSCRKEGLTAERLQLEVSEAGVMEDLIKAADGSMVHIRLAIEAARLERSPLHLAPASLTQAYTRYLQAWAGDGGLSGSKSLRRLLSLLVAVREPLSLAQLRQFGFEDAAEMLRRHTGFLFRVADDFKVYAFHKSVFDFLLSVGSIGEDSPWALSVQEGHALAFDCLAEELKFLRVSGSRSGPSDYCLRHLVFHGRESGLDLDDVVRDLDFWSVAMQRGVARHVMLDLLAIQASSRSRVTKDAARLLKKYLQEIEGLPGSQMRDRLLLRARDAPTSTCWPEEANTRNAIGWQLAPAAPKEWPPELAALRGHKDSVKSVAACPDGKLLASGSDDKTVRLWDAITGAPVGEPLRGHSNWVRSVAFSPCGKLLVSGGDDETLRLWDVATGVSVGEPLKGHNGYVRSVAFSPDGKLIASGSEDKTVKIWDTATGSAVGEPLEGHGGAVYSIAFSPDGKLIASANEDNTVRLWDSATGDPAGKALQGHTGNVNSVAFSPNGNLLASGSMDKTVRLWNPATGDTIGEPLQGHTEQVSSVAFSPDGKFIVSGGADKTVQFWDAVTGSALREPLQGHSYDVTSVAFSPDGNLVVSGGSDRTLRLWDATMMDSDMEESIKGHDSWVRCVAFSPDGKLLASSSADETVRIWEAATGVAVGEPLKGHSGYVYSVAFHPDGKLLASGSHDKTVRLWDATNQTPVGEPLEGHSGYVYSVMFSPCGKFLASASVDETVRLWDVSVGLPFGEPLRGHGGTVYSVAFSPDGKLLASASSDKRVQLWDVTTGCQLGQPLEGHGVDVNCVAFSPDGMLLASGSDDKTVRLWDTATRAVVGDPLEGHGYGVTSVVFSPDGKYLASGSRDKVILIWDTAAGTTVGKPLRGHVDDVNSVVFTPDGKVVASGSDDKTVRFWNISALETS